MKNLVCDKCNQTLLEEFNFCPNCGKAISDLARDKEKIVLQNAGLLKLQELSEFTKSKEVLKAIKEFLNK